ncbi:MAG: hypothetical protein ABI353_07260 [Isosphaeraceae bacterium]
MRRVGGTWAAGFFCLIALFGQNAEAQRYGRYRRGGYGYGGATTAVGDIARGMGMYYSGLGRGEQSAAKAQAINTRTALLWNQHVWAAQVAAEQRRRSRVLADRKDRNQALAAINERIHTNPSPTDITNGDALNAIYDQLAEPKLRRTALNYSTMPVSWDNVREIPYLYASEAIVISLQRLTTRDGWTELLRGPKFADERAAYQKAINDALEQDTRGDLEPKQIGAVRDAVVKLHDHLKATTDPSDPAAIASENFLKGLAGIAQMLQSPRVDEIVAALETYPGRTIGDLLRFLETFNLRFAPASTDHQKQIYADLFPILAAQRDAVVNHPPDPVAVVTTSGDPTALFHNEHWDHALGKWIDDDAPPASPNP